MQPGLCVWVENKTKQVITNRQHLYSVTPHFQRLPKVFLGCSCLELMLHGKEASLKDSWL